jgi:hypothetical protein
MKKNNFYLLVCVDIIKKSLSNPKNRNKNFNDIKFLFIVFMSLIMSLNLFVIMHLLQNYILNYKFYDIEINYFNGNRLDYIICYFILYFLPPTLINLITTNFILKNNELDNYKYYNGRLSFFYILISLIFYLVYLIFLAIKNSS